MSEKIDDIRRQIEGLDNKIQSALIKRAELALRVGEVKRNSGAPIIQPDREAVLIRRILSRHEGPLSKEAIVRIWREMIGAVSILQSDVKVAVTVPEDHTGLVFWGMAKDYFSSVIPMQKSSNPLGTMAMVREEDVSFGVMPWPVDGDENAWWS